MSKQIISVTGKIIAVKIPVFIFPSAIPDTAPTREGPDEHPKSPASASKANIAVPPVRREAAALLKVPGHIIPTEAPHKAHPTRLIIGEGVRLISKYEKTQSAVLMSIKVSSLILSPYFPYMARVAPITIANVIGPAKSPAAFEIPKPCSAKAEAHWLTACSLAPEQTIIITRTQKTLFLKSSLRVIPFSSELISGAIGVFINKIPFKIGTIAHSPQRIRQFSIPANLKNIVDSSTTPT